MFQSYFTELALRKAVIQISSGTQPISDVQQSAMSHAGILVKGQCDSRQQSAIMGWQEQAIMAAITAIKIAWVATSEQLKHLGRKRLEFDKERKSGIATFLIPTNKEFRDLAKEQKVMHDFHAVFEKDIKMIRYLGLKVDKVENDTLKVEGAFLSVLPYFKMSEALPEQYSSNKPSDKVRREISLFFKTQLPKYLGEINDDFDDNWKFTDFWRSVFKKDNFLNRYRGPRLIIMCLGNLLWNLQHPVDIESGFPLGLDDKVALCREVGVYINRLLDRETPPKLKHFDYDGEFINFVRQVETYVSELKFAFQEEKLHSLNMNEVSDRAHATARILNRNIFKMVYNDEKKAMELPAIIGYLNQLLKRDQSIFSVLSRFDYDNPLVNRPPRTIIDLLIVFTHMSYGDRKKFIDILDDKYNMTRKCFATTLKSYNQDFIEPIYKHCKKELEDGVLHSRKKSAQSLTAHRLLPLIGLAIEDYRIDVDTNETRSAFHRAKRYRKPFMTGKQQLEQITLMAYQNEIAGRSGYEWQLSNYLDLNSSLDEKINKLPRKQYKIGELTELLDAIHDFISQYRSFLQYSHFKNFVIHSLQTIGEEFSSLRLILTELEAEINVDNTEDRRLVDTIKSMDKSLLTEISKFTTIVKTVEAKISAPEFEDNIRQEVIYKLTNIDQQFNKAFGKHDEGLTSFIKQISKKGRGCYKERPQKEVSIESEPEEEMADIGQISRLSALISRCYFALSSESKKGIKGNMLLDLQKRLAMQPIVTIENVREVVLELSRMVCAYRPGFFQKPYAYTRSADVLVNAILESLTDERFPLAEMLFDDSFIVEMSLSYSPKVLIRQQLTLLRDQHLWAPSSDYLMESPVFAS